MAEAVHDIFNGLRKHAKSVILQLLETETHHAELIHREILDFSTELGSIAISQDNNSVSASNDMPTGGHVVPIPAGNPTSASNITLSEHSAFNLLDFLESPQSWPSSEMQDEILCFHPTAEQWLDFPTILQYARNLGVEKVGVCKVILPESVVGMSKPLRYTRRKAFRYRARPQRNGTFSLERSLQPVIAKTSSDPADILSGTAAVRRFEELLHNTSGLKNVRYCTDMDARTPEERESFNLPRSPLWPLKGNCLSQTRLNLPGIHSPYFYEAWDQFGAPFAMHREDGDLHSINYLWDGDKYWLAVPASHVHILEKKSKETNDSYNSSDCAQLLRHSATYYLTSTLDDWQIPYKLVHQKAGEVIITFPRVYHQGFSGGYTFAEAVNYADQNWSIEGYRGCDSQCCPEGSITKEMLEFEVREEEEQPNGEHLKGRNDLEPRKLKTQARKDDKSAPKTTTSSSEKLSQSIATATKNAALSNQGTKRKSIKQDQDIPKKTSRTDQSYTNGLSAFFRNFTPIPKGMIQPAEIHQIFADRSQSGESMTSRLLTRLFFGICSPDAFYQLRDACSASRQVKDIASPQSTNSISEAMQALDQLDATVISASILRRFYLVSLVNRRNQRETYHKSQRPKRVSITQTCRYVNPGHNGRTITKQDSFGRADTIALSELMAAAYPSLKPTRKHSAAPNDEYQKKLTSLKVRLRDGRNWHIIQEQLPLGILALVPTDGDYQIQNREVERLSIPLFSLLLELLIKFRGDFIRTVSDMVSQHICDILYRKDLSRKYMFENEENHLKQEPLDSNSFIKFCELDS